MRGLLVGDGYVSRESKRIVDFLIYFFSIYALYYSSNQKKKFKLSIVLDKRVFSFVWDAQMHACLRDNNQRSIFKENNSTGFLLSTIYLCYLSDLMCFPCSSVSATLKNLLCFYCAKNDHFCSSLIFFLFVWLICRCLWFLWWRETKVKRVIRPTTLFVCCWREKNDWDAKFILECVCSKKCHIR